MKSRMQLISACVGAALLLVATQATAQQCPDNMVNYWTADGTTADSVGSADGTLANGASYASGIVGEAFDVRIHGAYVALPWSPSYDFDPIGQFTLEAWVQPSRIGGWQAIAVKGNYDWDWGLYIDRNGRFMGGFNNNHLVTSNAPITPGAWYHVALIYDGGHWGLYVNGVLNSYYGGIRKFDRYPIDDVGLHIGRKGAAHADFFDGIVDELSLYNRALTGEEILAIYEAGADGKCTGPYTLQLLLERITTATDLHPNMVRPLSATVQAAIAAEARGDYDTIANLLNAFINKVNAQRGKKIPTALADEFITAAESIIANLP